MKCVLLLLQAAASVRDLKQRVSGPYERVAIHLLAMIYDRLHCDCDAHGLRTAHALPTTKAPPGACDKASGAPPAPPSPLPRPLALTRPSPPGRQRLLELTTTRADVRARYVKGAAPQGAYVIDVVLTTAAPRHERGRRRHGSTWTCARGAWHQAVRSHYA